MNCYAVFDQKSNKQLRVFAYDILIQGDYKRAEKLAFDMAHGMHNGGYPCIVELFHMCSVGRLVLNTKEQTMMQQFDDADDARDHARMMSDDGSDDWEEGICPACNGSGEGQHDGSVCPTCKGEGEC